mgnify:CR=1 FL=1
MQAPAPERLIKGGLPTEAMVAYVLVAKYAWRLQLYRQLRDLLDAVLLEHSAVANAVAMSSSVSPCPVR